MKKRNVVLSAFATISLCVSLIAGSTFALFTSESEVNIAVTSGKVSVVANIDEASLSTKSMGVEQASGAFENGGTASFDTNSKLNLNNMTPGDEASFSINIVNESNVTVKYRLNWAVDGKLAEVLTATANGDKIINDNSRWAEWKTTDEKKQSVNVSVLLPEDVGNDYQEESASISFTVEAVQGNAYTGPDANITRFGQDELPVRTPITGSLGGITFPEAPDEITVEAAWTFAATDTPESVVESQYKNWICDFVIECDKEVALGELGLWGAYGGMDFAFANPIALPEGQSLFMMNAVGMPLTYENICTDVREFDCGVFRGLVNPQMQGKTITVSLCLINPEFAEKLIEEVAEEFKDSNMDDMEILLEVMKKSRWESAIGTDVLIANKTVYTFE